MDGWMNGWVPSILPFISAGVAVYNFPHPMASKIKKLNWNLLKRTKSMFNEQLVKQIKANFADAVLKVENPSPDSVYLSIKLESLTAVVDSLTNQIGARFMTITGTDERNLSGNLVANYIFSFDKEKFFLVLKAEVDATNALVDSISHIVPGANWSEREIRDLVGLQFKNHPDPRRLILSDDFPEGMHPLRKDFPCDYKPPSSDEAKVKMQDPPDGATVVPIGPFYPVLEEPAYYRLFVEGEEVVGCDYRGFYSHRGIEKLGESKLTYNQVPFVAERI
jgi:Ni,Fe-hydrogenase III component G